MNNKSNSQTKTQVNFQEQRNAHNTQLLDQFANFNENNYNSCVLKRINERENIFNINTRDLDVSSMRRNSKQLYNPNPINLVGEITGQSFDLEGKEEIQRMPLRSFNSNQHYSKKKSIYKDINTSIINQNDNLINDIN